MPMSVPMFVTVCLTVCMYECVCVFNGCVFGDPQLEKCAQDLGSTSKAVGSSMAQLLTCAAQGNEHYTGMNL